MFQPGEAIAGKYKVTRLVGEGGMGLVYEAHHEALGLSVAVKVLRDEAMSDAEAVARFAREAKASAVLRGPHTARVFDVGELKGGRPFMVMEMLEGHDLGVELERQRRIPLADAASYVLQACEAIREAHEMGIVHRDLKPANIFLARAGSRTIVKILDFGISRFDRAGEQRVTQTQSAFGTPLYMSPEAIRSAKHTDARSDIWALGVILYELIAGDTPFMAETPTAVAVSITIDGYRPLSQVVSGIPREIDEIIARALEKDPNRRYQTVGELADALAPYAADATQRSSLAGPVSARGTTVMAPLSISSGPGSIAPPPPNNGYVVDTARRLPGVVARTNVDRPLAEKRGNGLTMLAIGGTLAFAVVGAGALLWLQKGSSANSDEPRLVKSGEAPASEHAVSQNDVRVERAVPSVDTADARDPTTTPATPTGQASTTASASPAPSSSSAAPTATESAQASPTAPQPPPGEGTTPKKPPPLAPSAPGGNPLIL